MKELAAKFEHAWYISSVPKEALEKAMLELEKISKAIDAHNVKTPSPNEMESYYRVQLYMTARQRFLQNLLDAQKLTESSGDVSLAHQAFPDKKTVEAQFLHLTNC